MAKYLDRYRIEPARLKGWDYGSPGLYFITICTFQGVHFFGEIRYTPVQPRYLAAPPERPMQQGLLDSLKEFDDNTREPAALRETEIGRIAREYWQNIPKFHPYVFLDEFVVMPNHIHGILIIEKHGYKEWNVNQFGPQSENLGSILRGYKSAVTIYAMERKIPFCWHSRYHDKIIRSEKALENIRNYIRENPQNWGKDKFYSPP